MAIKEPEVLNPFAEAVAQFDAAADRLNLSPEIRAILRKPKRELTVNFPVRKDDGSVEMYTVVGITEAEAAFARTEGGDRLVARLCEGGAYPVVDPYRGSVL